MAAIGPGAINLAASLSAAVYPIVPIAASAIQREVLFQYLARVKSCRDVSGARTQPIAVNANPNQPKNVGASPRATSKIAIARTGAARESGYTTAKSPVM